MVKMHRRTGSTYPEDIGIGVGINLSMRLAEGQTSFQGSFHILIDNRSFIHSQVHLLQPVRACYGIFPQTAALLANPLPSSMYTGPANSIPIIPSQIAISSPIQPEFPLFIPSSPLPFSS